MRDTGYRGILDRIADDDFQIKIRIDLLMLDGDILELMVFVVFDRQIPRGPSDIIMYETIALVELSIQDEMHMRVHQREGEDNDPISFDGDIDPIHPVDEIVFIEHHIDRISVCAEMPAVSDRNVLSFDKRNVQSQIQDDLSEQCLRNLHLHIRRHCWLLKYKDNNAGAVCQGVLSFFAIISAEFLFRNPVSDIPPLDFHPRIFLRISVPDCHPELPPPRIAIPNFHLGFSFRIANPKITERADAVGGAL